MQAEYQRFAQACQYEAVALVRLENVEQEPDAGESARALLTDCLMTQGRLEEALNYANDTQEVEIQSRMAAIAMPDSEAPGAEGSIYIVEQIWSETHNAWVNDTRVQGDTSWRNLTPNTF